MKLIKYILLLLVLNIACFHNEEVTFVPLSEQFRFDYNSGDTFVYYSNRLNISKFVISVINSHSISPSEPYDYEYLRINYNEISLNKNDSGFIFCQDSCQLLYDTCLINDTSIIICSSDSLLCQEFCQNYINPDEKLYISNDVIVMSIYWKGGFHDFYHYSQPVETKDIAIQGQYYEEVYEFCSDSTKHYEVYKIQFQHQYGILRYYYNNGEVFELKEVKTGNNF